MLLLMSTRSKQNVASSACRQRGGTHAGNVEGRDGADTGRGAVHATACCVYARRFEQKGFKLVALKMMQADEKLLKEHYKDLVEKPFFPGLLSYMTSGPVVPMVWEGDGVVKAGRTILGATKPAESAPGTVRGDYAIDVGRNVCHGMP